MKTKVIEARDIIALNEKITKAIEEGYRLKGDIIPLKVSEKINNHYRNNDSEARIESVTIVSDHMFIATMITLI